MLVLLIGFPSSVSNFPAFADDKDDNDNLKVSAKESKAYKKQLEKAEKARDKAEERKEKFEQKYNKFRDFKKDVSVILSSKTITLCHIPPGNPDNAHTIIVGTPAARAHLAHYDVLGECGGEPQILLDEREAHIAEKQAELEEKRAKIIQKQTELAQKYLEKINKLNERSQKILDKFNSGEYFGELYDQVQVRTFLLEFPQLIGESFVDSSDTSDFLVRISLETSSNPSSGHQKFKVTNCEIIGESHYECAFGKARSISSGPGNNNAIDIVAFLQDTDTESTSSLRAYVTPVGSSNTWFQEGTSNVSLMGKISLQWSLSGDGTLTVTEPVEIIHDETNDVDLEHEDEEEEADEIEIQGKIESINLDSQSFTLDTGEEIFVNENTEFDEGFDSLGVLTQGLEVDIDAMEIDGKLVATEIEIENELDDDEDDDGDDDEENDENEEG